MPASKLVSQLPVSDLRMPTSAVVGALCGGIVHRVRGGVDELHGGAGNNVRRRRVCYRAAMIAQEWRQVHGFQLQSQTMHELAIRLHGKQVDICGVFAAVFGCSPQRALRPTSYLEVALLPFLAWAAHSATQQRVWQGSEGFTQQFVGEHFRCSGGRHILS